MGWYSTHVIPKLNESALDRPDVAELRGHVCGLLAGEVVEVGFGSGVNVPYYPPTVTRVHAVEPSRVARRRAASRLAASTVPVLFAGDDAQRLQLADASMDSALLTFTLCAIDDPGAALSELHRVLVPGGTLTYVEHGRSPEADVSRWQRRLNGLNLRLSGCRLDRRPPTLLAQAGFEVHDTDEHYLAHAPRWTGYLYQGVARKPGSGQDLASNATG